MAEYYGRYPCHRVVNHMGRTAPGWAEQRALLEGEGVTFKAGGYVDLKKHRWEW
jgi:methylated-DNA-protein-cysteine methyltransferase-like protein